MKPEQCYLHKAVDEQAGRGTCRAFLRQQVWARGPAGHEGLTVQSPVLMVLQVQGPMWICRSHWLMHLRISKTTEPAVQRVRLNSGPNRGIGISALIAPHALSNTQTAITTFNLCVSFVPSWAVKCEPCIKLNILWWTLAFNFSFLVWYKHQFDVPSLPYYLVHPWTPTWTQKVMYKTLRFSMHCELSTHVLFPFQ